jgi:hypothetical protein
VEGVAKTKPQGGKGNIFSIVLRNSLSFAPAANQLPIIPRSLEKARLFAVDDDWRSELKPPAGSEHSINQHSPIARF